MHLLTKQCRSGSQGFGFSDGCESHACIKAVGGARATGDVQDQAPSVSADRPGIDLIEESSGYAHSAVGRSDPHLENMCHFSVRCRDLPAAQARRIRIDLRQQEQVEVGLSRRDDSLAPECIGLPFFFFERSHEGIGRVEKGPKPEISVDAPFV